MIITAQIHENIRKVRERIEKAAANAGRDTSDITLIAVSKTHAPDMVLTAIEAGIQHFGENRIQESEEKIPALKNQDITWHMLGHLQRNKAQNAVEMFDEFHALDSKRLSRRLQKQLKRIERDSWPVFVQVNVSGEPSKYGIEPEELSSLIELVGNECGRIHIKGLMTIAPFVDDEKILRETFQRLRNLKDSYQDSEYDNVNITNLSMGMSNDYEIAIEEGATHLRIGRAIFGEREGY